jgi:endonuclease/exonuclease/phosphatase (EEP) superfamily protein YafD
MAGQDSHDNDDPRPRHRAMRLVGLTACAVALLWPVGVLLWPNRPYLADLISTWVHLWVGVCALVAVAAALLRWWRLTGIAAVAMVLMAAMVFAARYPLAARVGLDTQGVHLRLVHYNAYGTHNPTPEAFIDWALSKKPDLIGIIEAAEVLKRHPRLLAELPHLQAVGYYKEPLYSRWPLEPVQLKTWDMKIIARENARFYKSWVVLPNDRRVAVFRIHPRSPRRSDTWSHNRRHIEVFHDYCQVFRKETGRPIISLGDYNATPSSAAMEWYRQRGLVTDTNRNLIARGTWPAAAPVALAAQIDYIFVTPEFRVVDFEIGPDLGSDHRPIFAEVALLPQQ